IPTAPAQNLSAAGQNARNPHVGVDVKGNAVVAWECFDGAHWRVQAERRSASGTLGPVQNLSKAGQDAEESQVAVDPKGNAMVVWGLFDGANWRIQARRRSASGTLSSVRTLSQAGQDAELPEVAVDPGGNATVVWQRSDGSNK